MRQMASATASSVSWNAFWWVLGSLCMPITIPYLVCKVMSQIRLRKNRDVLKDKVSFNHLFSLSAAHLIHG